MLEAQGRTDLQQRVETIRELLSNDSLFDSLSSIQAAAQEILGEFRTLYETRHADRTEQFGAAIEKIKGREEWTGVPETMREPVLGPLQSRCCLSLVLGPLSVVGEKDYAAKDLGEVRLTCASCGSTIKEMESDVAALGGLFAQVVAQIQQITWTDAKKVKRVRVAEFFTGSVETEDQVKQAVGRLQDHLLTMLAEGVKIVLE